MKRLKIAILSLCLVFALTGAVNAGNLQNAFDVGPTGNLGNAARGAGYNTNETGFDSTIANIIQAALSLVGVIFLALMIYGGFLWMTARGNEQQVEKAKNLIIAAVIGLIIVISAYAITYFIVSQISKGTLMGAS